MDLQVILWMYGAGMFCVDCDCAGMVFIFVVVSGL